MSHDITQPLVIVGADIPDTGTGRSQPGHVLVRDGVIADLGAGKTGRPEGAREIDGRGLMLLPGLIDMSALVGEPGAESRETLRTASLAAAAGGVTTIVCRPDTDPPVDDPAIIDFIKRRARDKAKVNILPAAAITKGLNGREMTEFGLLQEAGAIAFTDGPHAIRNSLVMRRALTYARDHGGLIMHHVEDPDLAGGGVMNESEWGSRLGLPGIPREAETIMLERDLRLVRLTGARYHARLISCAESVALIRRAKAEGLPVTCGVSINSLTLNENDIGDYRTFLKLSPPLREESERLALVEALAQGVIDVVVSDHDPQDVETKRLPFAEASSGAIGLETLLSAGLRLVQAGQVTLSRLIEAMTAAPAAILRLPAGRLERGAPADLILLDAEAPYVLDRSRILSRSKNTPFEDARLEGRVMTTLVGGRIVHEAQAA